MRIIFPFLLACLVALAVPTLSQAASDMTITNVDFPDPGSVHITGTNLHHMQYINLNFADGKVRYYRPGEGANPPGLVTVFSETEINIVQDDRIFNRYLTTISGYDNVGSNKGAFAYQGTGTKQFTQSGELAVQSPVDNRITISGKNIGNSLYVYILLANGQTVRVANPASAGTNPSTMTVQWSQDLITVTSQALGSQSLQEIRVSQNATYSPAASSSAWTGTLEILPLAGNTVFAITSVTKAAEDTLKITGTGLNQGVYWVLNGQKTYSLPQGTPSMFLFFEAGVNPVYFFPGVELTYNGSNTELLIKSEDIERTSLNNLDVYDVNFAPLATATPGLSFGFVPFTCPAVDLGFSLKDTEDVDFGSPYGGQLGTFNSATCKVENESILPPGVTINTPLTKVNPTRPNQIAYVRSTATNAVYVSNRDYSNSVLVSSSGTWPTWSNDGTKLSFLSEINSTATQNLHVVEVATNNAVSNDRALTSVPNLGWIGYGSFSTDDQTLYFTMRNTSDQNTNSMFKVDITAPTLVPVQFYTSSFPGGQGGQREDFGQKIVGNYAYYIRQIGDGSGSHAATLVRVNLTTGVANDVIPMPPLTNGSDGAEFPMRHIPAFSPDGSRFAYGTNIQTGSTSRYVIRSANADGTGLVTEIDMPWVDDAHSNRQIGYGRNGIAYSDNGQWIIGTCMYTENVLDLCATPAGGAGLSDLIRLSKTQNEL